VGTVYQADNSHGDAQARACRVDILFRRNGEAGKKRLSTTSPLSLFFFLRLLCSSPQNLTLLAVLSAPAGHHEYRPATNRIGGAILP
jgi:hypothetical protein